MPETAVNENYRIMFFENNVGFARESFNVFAETKAQTVQKRTDNNLRLGIRVSDTRLNV